MSHSRFTPAERLAAWRESLENNEPLLILGARSAVFMPMPYLGLIIVDEEHEVVLNNLNLLHDTKLGTQPYGWLISADVPFSWVLPPYP